MARQRSETYMRIRDRIAEQLGQPDWYPWGPRWRNRVGLTRMTAANAAGAAHTLLMDINLSTHRDDAELAGLLVEARAATEAYYGAVVRDNWGRLKGTK